MIPITSNVKLYDYGDSTLINQVVAVDPDGNLLTFSLQRTGQRSGVVNTDGTFSYQPNLNFNGRISLQCWCPMAKAHGSFTVTVIVTPVNDAPTVPNYTFSTQEDSLW
ncbi:Ig-like domain-containing protein [Priestia aryabhattai]